MKPVVCSVFFIVIIAIHLQAQRFGGNSPAVKWKQVNTSVAKIIYPEGMDSFAIRVANIVERLNDITLPTIGEQQKKISIVLHPNTIISNGYVGLGPFRSEFYLTPDQNSFELGSIRWQDMLAIHEYRHVQQYSNFNVGLSKAFHTLFGQNGQALANAITVPNWFFEGDAVFQETLVSQQGRGRLPFFYNDYRSLWLANKTYSYMKLRNGSLRDFTPDHYRLGYMLVAYGREKYGDDFWKKVTHDAAAFKGLFYPFQKAVKQYSGKSFKTFTKEAVTYFKNQSTLHSEPQVKEQPTNQSTARPLPRHFTGDQQFPSYSEDESIVYVNSSYKEIPAFILKKGTEERKIRVKDVSIDNQFSYGNGRIVYASYRPATRWGWNDYNELQVLDVTTGNQKTITHHSKYFSPGISKDGKKIVAVYSQPGEKTRLHLLDADNGTVISELPNKEDLFYTYPEFISDTQVITAARMPSGQMAMVLVNTKDGSTNYLTPASYRVMGSPVVQHDTIYFTAAGKQYDELFALTTTDKKIFRLAVPANGIGVYQPAVGNNSIVFTSFTANGYRLQESGKSSITWEEVAGSEWGEPAGDFGINLTKNKAAGLLASVPSQKFSSEKYPQTAGLFNFHSIYPYVDDPNYTLSVVGNNVLNTMESELFFTYNRNEQYKQVGFNGTYGGLYPYLSVGVNYTIDRKDFIDASHPNPVYWNEGQANIGLSIPLNLSKGKNITGLTFGADYVLKNVRYKGYYKDSFNNFNLAYINSYISFSNQIQQARQQIYPHLAQSVYINYRNAIQKVEANQFLASGSFYWPGLFATHSFVVNLAYQHRDTLNQYRFSNSFPFSRGYESPNLRNMYKWGVNYHLPLAYPDWGFGGMVYFQRIRANLFYDYTVGTVAYNNGARLETDFRSTGAEIFFDTKWWNQLPVNFGFRYSHLLDRDLFGGTGAERFEFVLPVNLFQR